MEINEFIVSKITDPTGILEGERYEFLLFLDVDEDDDLYSETGVGLRVLFVSDQAGERIATYHFFERSTEKVLDFELEDDEKIAVLTFCIENKAD
jgi:hypothetical protein